MNIKRISVVSAVAVSLIIGGGVGAASADPIDTCVVYGGIKSVTGFPASGNTQLNLIASGGGVACPDPNAAK